MSTYNFPKNTDSTLYINLEYENAMSSGTLIDNISDHFGADCTLDQFTLEYERIKVTGCGCCYDSSDWTEYLRVEKVKDSDQSTGIQKYSLGHMIAPAQI